MDQRGQLKAQIRQLEEERLPGQRQKLMDLENRISETFSQEYQERTGLPRYEQELARLKRAAAVHKNFSDQLPRTINEREQTREKLLRARQDYAEQFKPCPFRVDAMDNEEYESERQALEDVYKRQRDQLLVALDFLKPATVREGVKWLPEKMCIRDRCDTVKAESFSRYLLINPCRILEFQLY